MSETCSLIIVSGLAAATILLRSLEFASGNGLGPSMASIWSGLTRTTECLSILSLCPQHWSGYTLLLLAFTRKDLHYQVYPPIDDDEEFVEYCRASHLKRLREEAEAQSRRSPEVVSMEEPRLTDHYPAAYTDLPGAATVYKSRQPVPGEGPISRELRLVSAAHPIQSVWPNLGGRIQEALDAHAVKWNSIDPTAFAEEGEAKPFCPFLVWIGVQPESLSYDTAVAAADAIKGILAEAGYPEIEVAFRESVNWR